MTHKALQPIREITLDQLAKAAREAGRDAARRAAAAGLKVTTMESLLEKDAARAPKRA